MDKLILAFCRLGFAGLSPIMPGTCGSALAAVLAPFLFIPLPFVARIVVLVLVFWIGGMAATRGEQILGYKDPGEIVIDELLGMWLVLLPFSDPGWAKIGIAFVLFRIFDMWKPWPVHASESWLPGGYGIMIDDVMAGLQALLVMWLLQLSEQCDAPSGNGIFSQSLCWGRLPKAKAENFPYGGIWRKHF